MHNPAGTSCFADFATERGNRVLGMDHVNYRESRHLRHESRWCTDREDCIDAISVGFRERLRNRPALRSPGILRPPGRGRNAGRAQVRAAGEGTSSSFYVRTNPFCYQQVRPRPPPQHPALLASQPDALRGAAALRVWV